MIFASKYRKSFWHGLFHAMLIVVYTFFLTLMVLQLQSLYQGEIGLVIRTAFGLFLAVISVGVYGWLLFFEPVKLLFHHHFKEGTVLMLSTLGWLFIFLMVFLFGLVFTLLS